jgi:2-keto-4-pentenoate hydratase/2-oxohepta-3-ene-1,7-dioic acid hydratase in catechol pathway
MRIATYWWGGQRHVGRLSDDGARITALACGDRARAVGALALIESLAEGRPLPRTTGTSLPLAAVTLDAPIPVPRRNIFCSGVNYRAHAAEWEASGIDRRLVDAASGSVPAASPAPDDPPYPVIFSKVGDCVVGHGVPIQIPVGVSEAIDYEAELAVLIGRAGRNIPVSRAMEHVFGYTIFNDVTARDVQTRHRQWLLGKSFDTFGPMGPCIAGVDELDGIGALENPVH